MERQVPFLHKPYSLAQLYEKLQEVIHEPAPAPTADPPVIAD
jgi:hypothetical protein